jgi:uncharacterized protein YfdQ (DUF2303 family)
MKDIITMDTNTTEARDIMDLGSALSDPISAPPAANGCSIPFVVVPNGYNIKHIESLFANPSRNRGNTDLLDMVSFAGFVNDHKGSGAARLYGRPPAIADGRIIPPSFCAVFNDSWGAVAPAWRDHTATWTCPLSPEWMRWVANSGKHMKQDEFARFIEDNLPDIASPPAADMLDLSRTLEAKKSVNFASSTRLSNGETQLKFEEQIDGTARGGQMKIPDTFEIGIPVLLGGEGYRIEARFRYRIDGSKLSLWYELVRPHKIVEAVFRDLRVSLHEATGLAVFVSDFKGLSPQAVAA